MKHFLTLFFFSDTRIFQMEPKKEKDTRQQSKSQCKAKKTSNRRSQSKKESSDSADICPPDPSESRVVALSSEEAGNSVEPQPGTGCSPVHRLFQRKMSPADVLHVHSYAKGDYGEGEALPKEEKKSEGIDNGAQKDNRPVSKAVRYRCYTHTHTHLIPITHVNGAELCFQKVQKLFERPALFLL